MGWLWWAGAVAIVAWGVALVDIVRSRSRFTGGQLAAPIFELPKAITGLRRTDPQARERLIDFLVDHREVMSYTP